MWLNETPELTKALDSFHGQLACGYNGFDSYKLLTLQERIKDFRKEYNDPGPYKIELDAEIGKKSVIYYLSSMNGGNYLRWLSRIHEARIMLEGKVLKFVPYTPDPSDPGPRVVTEKEVEPLFK